MRIKERRGAIDGVVYEALAYDAETQRDDNAHRARMSKRIIGLRQAIEDAYEAMHMGPIDDEELAMAKSIRELERDTET